MTQSRDSLVFRVTGTSAQDTVLWASETARKITYFNSTGRKLSEIFCGYFSAENHELRSGTFVSVEGVSFIANVMSVGLDDCVIINLLPLSGYFDSVDEDDASLDEEVRKKTLALKLAVRDLEINRQKLRQSSEVSGTGSFEYVHDQHCLVLTPEACNVLGMESVRSVVGADEICSRVQNGKLSGMCDALMSASLNAQLETEITIKDDYNSERHIKVVMRRLSQNENILDGVFMDITFRKNAEKELKKHDAYYRVLYDKANIGIFNINTSGHIIDCNTYFEKLTGYALDELRGRSSSEMLVFHEDRDRIRDTFYSVVETSKNSAPVYFRLLKKDGGLVDVLVSFELLVADEDDVTVFGFLSDITNYKHMQMKNMEQERMLLQQSKMATMGEMMGIIAHQWMQPLNSIAMISQMMQELLEVDEESEKLVRKTVSSILEQINFMTATANDFRSFLKPSEKPVEFNLVNTVKSVLELYRPQLKYHNIKCGMFFGSEDVQNAVVYGYENEFKNVMLNLCTNAKDALEQLNIDNGEIEIFFETEGDKIMVSVCDNGGGIPEAILKKIFSAYVSSKGEKGTGLGLYMSRLIITERMDGDIIAENTEEGARIKVILKNRNYRKAER